MKREFHPPKTSVYIDWKKLDKVAQTLLQSSNAKDLDLGLAIAIGIRTGLRKSDLMVLEKSQFRKIGDKYWVVGIAKKTKKRYKKALPKELYDLAISSNMPLIYSRTYAHNWLGRSLQRLFPREYADALKGGDTISAHSLRKSFGMQLYRNYSINEAKNGLQHSNIAVTTMYLNLPQIEQEDKEASIFC